MKRNHILNQLAHYSIIALTFLIGILIGSTVFYIKGDIELKKLETEISVLKSNANWDNLLLDLYFEHDRNEILK